MSARSAAKSSTRLPPHEIPPKKLHLDKRAHVLLATGNRSARDDADDGDDLLSTQELAQWLGVSPQWLIIGRSNKKAYGPKFIRVATRRIAYRRSDVRAWLEQRTYSNTGEYPKNVSAACDEQPQRSPQPESKAVAATPVQKSLLLR